MFSTETVQKFAKNNCIICRDETRERIFIYDDVIKAVKHLSQKFQEQSIPDSVCLAINLKDGHTAASIVLLLTILNHRCYFCPLPNQGSEQEFNDYLNGCGASFLLTNDDLSQNQTLCEVRDELQIFDEEFLLYKVKKDLDKITLPPNVCYLIGTSGSTGEPKMVYVPIDCIAPNIDALSARFQLTSDDIIFLGTPITFDPFVVELFMALSCGAAVLITTSKFRLSQKLVNILFPKNCVTLSVTILQMTPSLFRQFGVETIRDAILARDSALRVLILGGEVFPKCTELKKWLPENCAMHKRIFNIYGITEVSCWSTIHELNTEEILSNKYIPLGQPIDNKTILRVKKMSDDSSDDMERGELLIGSATRRTFIPQIDDNVASSNVEEDNEGILYRHTGDFVECDLAGEIHYIGRLNNVIKRLGKRINLDVLEQKIENLFCTIEGLKVTCLWNQFSQSLICCLKCNSVLKDPQLLCSIKRQIIKNLPNYEKPDWIEPIEELPLNKHGKMDRNKLLHVVTKTENTLPANILRRFLSETLMLTSEEPGTSNLSTQVPLKRRKIVDAVKSFTTLGGTSFHALSLATEIGQYLKNPTDQRLLLEKFLDPKIAVEEILVFLENVPTCKEPKQSELLVSASPPLTSFERKLEFLWRVDLQKCVDATPAIDIEKRYVCIGSHAHILITVDASNGNEVSRLKLKSRIECEAAFVTTNLALVGCNAGYLYAFNFLSGELYWSLYIGCKVKAKPLVIDATHAMIGCYDEAKNLVYICLKTQNIKWRRKLGNKPIFSSPIRLDTHTALVCTLDGTCERLDLNTGNIIWTRKCTSPIFSTPTIIDKDYSFGIAEVGGEVHICKTENGDILHTFVAEGNVFSNLTLHCASKTTKQLIFGSHDHHVYCLNYDCGARGNEKASKLNLIWKKKMGSAIYATPIIAQLNAEQYVIACSTNGVLSVLELSTGSISVAHQLKGDVFSTPCCTKNNEDELRVCFGCRDNFLYCFRLY